MNLHQLYKKLYPTVAFYQQGTSQQYCIQGLSFSSDMIAILRELDILHSYIDKELLLVKKDGIDFGITYNGECTFWIRQNYHCFENDLRKVEYKQCEWTFVL